MPIEIPKHENGCPFCGNIIGKNTQAVVEETDDVYAFLNPRQFGKGHILVIPKRHAATILELEADEVATIMREVHRLTTALSKAFDPCGFNVFQNNGLTAGQMVAHYHVHIVPTYPGDPPGKIFSSDNTERVPIEDRLELAKQIIAHLG